MFFKETADQIQYSTCFFVIYTLFILNALDYNKIDVKSNKY